MIARTVRTISFTPPDNTLTWITHIAFRGAFPVLADFAVLRTWFRTNHAKVGLVPIGTF